MSAAGQQRVDPASAPFRSRCQTKVYCNVSTFRKERQRVKGWKSDPIGRKVTFFFYSNITFIPSVRKVWQSLQWGYFNKRCLRPVVGCDHRNIPFVWFASLLSEQINGDREAPKPGLLCRPLHFMSSTSIGSSISQMQPSRHFVKCQVFAKEAQKFSPRRLFKSFCQGCSNTFSSLGSKCILCCCICNWFKQKKTK